MTRDEHRRVLELERDRLRAKAADAPPVKAARLELAVAFLEQQIRHARDAAKSEATNGVR